MKNTQTKKFIISGILVFFLLIGAIPAFAHTDTDAITTIEYSIDFSEPILTKDNDGSKITVSEANAVTTEEGCPRLPVFSKTFEFPLGTTIVSIDIHPSTIQTMRVEKQILPTPTKQKIGDLIVPVDGVVNEQVYASADPYPKSWYTITTGAGLNNNNDHTPFITIRITPARYTPNTQILQYSTRFSIQINYEATPLTLASSDEYFLVIITPAEFSELLQPLVEHKNVCGIPTLLVTLDEIYNSYVGRDNPERIKYFIRDAVEDWNTHYVLLIGDMKKLPIRVTYASWWERDLLSDLYYADIYDANEEFCTWDANGNNRFGEIDHDGNDLDGVDLYADVHVGRLACVDATEVITVVDKIITYEEETYNQIWFKRLILAGGDTFPVSMGAPPFVYEGEITNVKVGQTMPDFDLTYLWTSKYTLHTYTFNWAINRGAGFVSYSGHGFEHGWGTSRPNAITKIKIFYYTPFINGLKNSNKLPIIFFDACLTAKLDFNVTDLQHYYPRMSNVLVRLFSLSSNPSDFYQCFGWSFLAKENGGAIATIGSTRTAYTWVDSNGVYGGAGYLNVHFFDAYEEGITVGQMLTGSQNAYIQNVGLDYFTIEEFILLGDPSLMVGGYP
ncbi:MAG TPA: C25 family cysteine peptidase [Candidatus Thermoplasmatota archaeon]|nr:C25 family cysteine peptidase [Candidatus Thermoplasmatota archaeon]